MIFQYTLEAVLTGYKTQTRRLIGKHDSALRDENGTITAILVNGRAKWCVGKSYAVQARRTGQTVGRILLTGLREEVVKDISAEDARAEGFPTRDIFLQHFRKINGVRSIEKRAWVLIFTLEKPD